MLKVVQWPKGRAQEYVARVEKDSVVPNLNDTHDAFLRTMMDHFRSDALNVAPVLSHLNPMLGPVTDVLMSKIDDLKEPLVAAEIIRGLGENKALSPEIAERLVLKALDNDAPVDVRVAAINAVARLKPQGISKLAELRGNADDKIARALIDNGLQ